MKPDALTIVYWGRRYWRWQGVSQKGFFLRILCQSVFFRQLEEDFVHKNAMICGYLFSVSAVVLMWFSCLDSGVECVIALELGSVFESVQACAVH
jgi:hypothetical protein